MKRILIIEDDALIARVYGTKYAAAGFETSIASDGEEGLELVKTFKPDLVHLDLLVPKVNGADVIRHIRSQPELESLPVIVLTNTYQNRLVKTAMEAGATECVSKSTCTPKMMLEIVEKYRARMIATPTAPEPPPSPPSTPASALLSTTETERNVAFQTELQDDFRKRAPQMLAALHERVEPVLRAETEVTQVQELSQLCRTAHAFAGHAGIAGFQEVAQMSSALVALLRELLEKPKEITPSSLRTIVDACDTLTVLSASSPAPPQQTAAVVLAVDDDVICRRAVRLALARLDVAAISVEDPQMALRLLAENPFSLILLDVEMPGMNGFELCRELRKLSTNQATPVLFVTSLADFGSRDRASASGGNDLIAKPFLPMELAVRTLSLLRRSRLPPQP
jgi:DNA-binding response OmpR family regulator